MSEIRVNNIVSADGIAAPTLPYGVQLPTGIGITGAGGLNITGVVTAANIDGTLIAGSAINSAGVSTVGILTVTKDARIGAAVTVDGAATVTGALTGSTGTYSGAVNIDATTDSTSTTTGALIVDGGVGIAKNVYIGAGLSIAGTLTYEDVTNVDSVGVITAKSGVNVSGGQLQVGVAYSVGNAGVVTAKGATFNGDVTFAGSSANIIFDQSADDLIFNDNAKAFFGTSSDGLEIYHDGSHSYIKDSGTGYLRIQAADYLQLGTAADSDYFANCEATTGAVVLKYAGSSKLATTNDGTVTTGIATATGGISLNADSKKITVGVGSDLAIYHDGSHSFISNQHGTGNLALYGNGTNSIVLQAQAGDNGVVVNSNDSVQIYWDGSERIRTTGAGTSCVGISTFQDFSSYGMLRERVEIVANKLSAGTNIDLEKGNIWYYSTNETTTATPNIRYNSSISLNNKMLIGETVTVSIISKPNGAGYYDALTVDGSGVTEEWNGGAAPSAANAGGYDVLTHTLVKTADATFLCLSNVQNYA